MLDDLVQTIEMLRERISGHRPYFSEGKAEARTRAALIDPMLSALGWNVADPSLVEIEPRTKEGWADYALVSGGRTVMFVEAKKLNEDIDQHFQQTINYAVGENVGRSPKIDYCAVTNGDAWRVLDVREQEIIMSVSIARDDSSKAALQFLGLWRRSLRNGGFDAAAEPLFSQETLTPPPHPAPQPVASAPVAPAPSPHVATPTHISSHTDGWIPLTGELNASWRNQPARMRLPDGEEVETPSWREVIRATTRWLQAKGRLTPDTDLSAGVMSTFIRSDGGTFDRPMQMTEGIVLNGNFTGASHIRNAILLLTRCGQDPSQVQVRLVQ